MRREKEKSGFWKIFWASGLSKLAFGLIGGAIMMLIFFSILGSFTEGFNTGPLVVQKNSVLHMKLEGQIGETSKATINPLAMNIETSVGLSDILTGINEAAKDENIDGIYLELGSIQAGIATVSEIREALERFKESGKGRGG